jgi:hypothetical protein
MTTIGVAGVMMRIPDGQYTSTVYGMIRDGKYQEVISASLDCSTGETKFAWKANPALESSV